MTEVDNIGVKTIQKSLLEKNDNNINQNSDKNNNIIINKISNSNIETYSKKMVNNKPKNINISINLNQTPIVDDFIRMNTLYNKDDSEDLPSIKREINNNIINNQTLTVENNESNYINHKTELGNNNINSITNGLSINNNNHIENNDSSVNNKTKSVEKDLILNNLDINKEKEKEKNKLYINLPVSNQIYKQEKIMKFINQKTSSMPKSKEDSKKNIPELENGKLHMSNNINKNKNKIKNRYSQENLNQLYKNIHGINNGITTTRPNGSNDLGSINKYLGIYSNINNFKINNLNNNVLNMGDIGNILYVKKKRKPKSIDDNINRKNFLRVKKDSKNNMTNESKNINQNTNNNKHNNKEIYSKVNHINNYKKQFYRDKISEQKILDDPYLETFRYKKLSNNINKLNKKNENDSNNNSNFTQRLNTNINSLYINNNNYIIEKGKNREYNNKGIFNKEGINYVNIKINKNQKLHEHNSFEAPKKNRIKNNYINNSVEKNKYVINNNNLIISKYANNNNYYKLNKKIKQYYRNIGSTKQNQPVTQYYAINNYNIDNIDKISSEKMQSKNQRLNYRLSAKMKANSVDLQANKSKSNTDKNSNNKIKSHKRAFLNTSVIKDKTPKNFITSFFKEKNKLNNIHRNNYYLHTIENNNMANNTHKNIDENRYLTYKDNDNLGTNSTRRNHIQKYLFPHHKRNNFSQEPEKKRKDNDVLEIFSIYGKGNSFIFNNLNKNNLVTKKEKKKVNNINHKEQKNNTNNLNNVVNLNINRNIYSRLSIEKIRENVEKIIGNKTEIKKYKNSLFMECKYKGGSSIICFRLTISKNHQDFFTISPIIIKGNQDSFKLLIEKIKNKLM